MTVVQRAVASGLVLFLGVAAVTLLSPGGLGEAQPEVVTEGMSAELYRDAVTAVDTAPGWLQFVGEHVAVLGLLTLTAMLAWTAWTGWRHRTEAATGAVLVGVGATLAYLISEAAKLVVDEERPCRAFIDVVTWESCPPPGDWSFPSNHSTVAGAFGVGLALLLRRLGVLTVAIAAVVAGMRVVAGVHYPHDVLAGVLLGAAVTAALVLLFNPVAARLVYSVGGTTGELSTRERESAVRR